MAISSNKPFFHVVDTETTGLSPQNKQTGLLQLYSTNLPPFQGARPFDPRTLVKPSRGYRELGSNKQIQFNFNFSAGKDVLTAAQRMGVSTEEETAGHFFAAASEELSRKRRFIMAGWNPAYDVGVLETISQRYASLGQYRGFFQKPGVKVIGLEKPFLEFSHWYAQSNPEFASRYIRTGPSTPVNAKLGPGVVPTSAEEMRYVPGWSVENITKAAGGREKLIGAVGQFHEAITDVELEQQLFEKFRFAKKVVQRGYSFDIALQAAGVLPEGQTAETFFKQVFSSSWSGYLAKQAEKGIAALPPKPNAFAGQATKVLLVAAAAAAAYAIASSKRQDRQTQITGLQDTGTAQVLRHKLTDFGSGWVGRDNNSDNTLKFLMTASAVYGLHKWAASNWSGYAEGIYQTIRKIEERSPGELFKTFGVSQLASGYRAQEVFLRPEQLFAGNQLTETGKHLQRLLRINPTEERFRTGMRFTRTSASSPYLELEGAPGYKVRFAERGRLTASSARYGMDLRPPMAQRYFAETPLGQVKEFFQHIRDRHTTRTPLPKSQAFRFQAGGEDTFFHPLYGRRPGFVGGVRSAYETGSRVAFEAAERPLRLLRDIGLGVNYGSYNKLLHIPGIGQGGLLNKLIFGRVLPIYAGVTLARYANYKLENKPAETIASIPLHARMAWAEATEQVPGLRSLTDKYAEIVPGPQYGPLALPLGAGALATVLGHYLPVAAGTKTFATRAARTAASRAMFKKGAKWGLLAMVPFVPGMIGSRKTPEELQRIYSGEEEVPIRSGRWWDVGCQIEGSWMSTNQGIHKVEDIYNSNLQILNGHGLLESPAKAWRYLYNGKVYSLKTYGWTLSSTWFTENHEVLILRNNEIMDVKISEVSSKDFVLVPRVKSDNLRILNVSALLPNLLHNTKQKKLYRKQKNWSTHQWQQSGSGFLPDKIELDYSFGFLCGHYLAEGNLNSSKKSGLRGVEHVAAFDELNILYFLKDIYEQLGSTAVLYKSSSGDRCYRLRISNSCMADLFFELFHKLGRKLLPIWLLEKTNKEFRKGILEGWFYGDGSFQKANGRITAANIKIKELENALSLRTLLASFGAACGLNEEDTYFPEETSLKSLAGKSYHTHIIRISIDGLLSLSEQSVGLCKGCNLPVETSPKISGTRKYKILDDYIAYQVKEVEEKDYSGNVYDFTIASDSHYVTANYVTHNSTPFSGGRIKYFRPHWYSTMKAKAEMVATYGSEDAYWEHHPLLHPIKYIKDPYWVERANYYSRPYPITSPAFSNVPLVGPLLAATIGRVIKPPIRLHEKDWDINNYTLYSPRIEPNKALGGLPPATPREEFSLKDVGKREAISFAEYTGLPGFITSTIYGAVGIKQTPGQDVVLQGSRQMTSWSRQYYQRELGALSGLNPNEPGAMPFGYSEPLRRFIQPEKLAIQANEIPNTMPRWMPGEDYMINFRTGDPYARIPEGAARLPGPAYEALHPELKGLSPSEYPDFYRYKILADVAPYSKEYLIYRAKIRKLAEKDTKLQIQYDRIEDQVSQIKASSIQVEQRRFTAPVENITGTIKKASPQGIELSEYPGRLFTLSSVGTSASDLSAVALGEKNNLSRTETARSVERREAQLQDFLVQQIGMKAKLVVPKGTEEHATEARAVVFIDDVDLNKAIIDQGLGRMRKDLGGAEAQAMYTSVQQSLGRYAETLAFTGEGGPTRLVPTPFHTKYWNERTALSLYQEQEVYGSRMRRWQRPFHDMAAPWARGLWRRITGNVVVPQEVEHKRELDSLTDELSYLRAEIQAAAHLDNRGRYTSQAKRTNVGGNLFGNPQFVSNTLPRREKLYFQAFLQETDPDKRKQILASVSPELSRTLTAQWVKKDAIIARAAGREVPAIEEGGVLYTEKQLKEYKQAKTDLTYSDFVRSKEIAETFTKLGFNLPGPGSPLWSEGMDYEDVKLKIIQDEGYDYHDFNIYDDRVATLWRKPYIDGAVRELTSGGTGNTEQTRQIVERIIQEGNDKNPGVMATSGPSRNDSSSIRLDVDEQSDKQVMTDIRRNEDEYRSETAEQ